MQNDPGHWWATVAALHRHRMSWFPHNTRFWELLCDPDAAEGLLTETARAARAGLEALRVEATYASAPSYLAAVAAVARHIDLLTHAEGGFGLSFDRGPVVRGLDYGSSSALLAAATEDSLLADLVEAALSGFPTDADVVMFYVTSPEDLCTAMMAAACLRRASPRTHLCLADHGYENFSLQPHIEKLEATGALTQAFDTIIVSKDERDTLVPRVIAAVASGEAPRGFLRADCEVSPPVRLGRRICAPPATPLFTPAPVLATRISARRCYWNRCTFCVQNVKFDDPRVPSRNEVPAVLDRLEALVGAGYRTLLFSDEALSPALLGDLCRGILERGLSFRWACRCKLELAHRPELFRIMRQAGCFEVLYGLESIVPATQRRMDKHVDGLDAARVRQILEWMDEAGIAAHVNLIGAFPGETAEELAATVDFAIDALGTLTGATFLLNEFTLFAGAPMLLEPGPFGLRPRSGTGDLEYMHAFDLIPPADAVAAAAREALPREQARLFEELGWNAYTGTPEKLEALRLYFSSGHGAILKCRADNPLGQPVRPRPAVLAS